MTQYLGISLIGMIVLGWAYFVVKKLFFSNLPSIPSDSKIKSEIDVNQKPSDKESPNE